jgi:hypothetical protein
MSICLSGGRGKPKWFRLMTVAVENLALPLFGDVEKAFCWVGVFTEDKRVGRMVAVLVGLVAELRWSVPLTLFDFRSVDS